MAKETTEKSQRNLLIAFLINLSFTVLEIVGGILTNSIAIMSDAIHDLGDSIALGLSYILQRVSDKDPDEAYTFGYDRFSLLGALITSLILFGGTIYIFTQSIPRLLSPEPVNPEGMLLFAILGIIFNGLAFYRLQTGDTLNEKSVALHLLEDLLGWVAILIGSIVLLFVDFYILDTLLSIGIAIFIIVHVIQNLHQVFHILLQKAPSDIKIDDIKKDIEQLNGVFRAYHIHLWMHSDERRMMSVHIVVDPTNTIEQIIELKNSVRKIILGHDINHVTIECELPG